MMTNVDMLRISKPLIQRLITHDKWLDLLNDFRSEEGIATHFGISVNELQNIKDFWEIK